MKILTEMKRIIIACCLVLVAMFANAQSWNPYVNQAITSPAPLLPWEFGGTGVLSFNVGNSGSDPLTLVANQEMTIIFTLSDGIPNNDNPLLALGGTWLDYFNWTYDAVVRTYTGTQNKIIPGTTPTDAAVGTITIQYKVIRNSSVAQPSNGFNLNIQPPDYTNGVQAPGDDQASSYTYVRALDFGDAPVTYGSAWHEINLFKDPGEAYYLNYVYLGISVDPEAANQPSGNADGDDTGGTDDENGVTFPELTPGATVTIPVTITIIDGDITFATYRLNAWMDWNGDGDFLDAGERIANNISIDYFLLGGVTGTYNLSVTVPANATTSPTYARFRLGGPVTSPFNDPVATTIPMGEVEDYRVIIGCPITNNTITQPNPASSCTPYAGTTIMGSVPAPGGGTYLWEVNSGSGFVAAPGTNNTQNYTTGALTAGIYTFQRKYTTTSGVICSTTSNSVTITVNATPAAPTGIAVHHQQHLHKLHT